MVICGNLPEAFPSQWAFSVFLLVYDALLHEIVDSTPEYLLTHNPKFSHKVWRLPQKKMYGQKVCRVSAGKDWQEFEYISA